MNIVIFTHPEFFDSFSIKKYSGLLAEGMRSRNHTVEFCTPGVLCHRMPISKFLKKWIGYVESLVVFPIRMRSKLKNYPTNSLFVFSDQALGPWVHLVKGRPHVIHCHDFLALESAIDIHFENRVSWTGKIYQRMIQKGFSKGENFISISQKTKNDLHRYLLHAPVSSYLVYNQISPGFRPINKNKAIKYVKLCLKISGSSTLNNGYVLHVGANVWYKNKRGVLEIYHAWRKKYGQKKPLLMVGELDAELQDWIENKFWKQDLYILKNISEKLLVNLYSGASVLLFPSLAEGFGWPIAEAMACGCAVITTDEAPMTEVGGKAAFYISKRPVNKNDAAIWAICSATVLQDILLKNEEELKEVSKAGLAQVQKFKSSEFFDQIEEIYLQILKNFNTYHLVK